MLILRGTLRATATLGGGVDKKTGQIRPVRPVLQVETVDARGLVQVETITVPALDAYLDKVGSEINLPVRAWASSSTVHLVFEPAA